MKSLAGRSSYFYKKFLKQTEFLGSSSSSQAKPGAVETKGVEMDSGPVMGKGKEISASSSGTKLSENNYASGSSHDFGSSSGMFDGGEEYDDRHITVQSYFDDLNIPTGIEVEVPIPWLNSAVGNETIHSNSLVPPVEASGGADDMFNEYDDQYAILQSYFDDLDIPTGVDFEIPLLDSSSTSLPLESENANKKSASGLNLGYDEQYAVWQSYFDDLDIPTGVEIQIPCLNSTMPSVSTQKPSGFHESSQKPLGSQNMIGNSHDKILEKFDLFKRFDVVQDYSDHYYAKNGSLMKQPSKSWAKKIQGEWRILEKDLPEAIYVRVYESRMDLLRAVIVGAEGTPYHDGLFFFDVFFPDIYPSAPPMVYYHSHGLRINPNLYSDGKVCLSLLNTWTGGKKEMWNPCLSTILQVLVSIQALILNAEPYFNEPGYEAYSGKPSGETNSLLYNENTFISSLKTMVYTIRKPPRYFEDFVAGHFHMHAHDILSACEAYSNGAQVGSLVTGSVPKVHGGDKNCSNKFKNDLARCMKTVADAFAQVGLKDG